MFYTALIVAAGNGSRMNLGYNKVYCNLGTKTVLERTMDGFLNDQRCRQLVIVTDPEMFHKHIRHCFSGRVVLVSGGDTRQQSVAHGLEAVISDVVLIHDGARPFLDRDSLDAIVEAMETEQAACLTVACKDTIKQVKKGYIQKTLNRDSLVQAQTPQAFRTDLILKCMRQAIQEGFTGTDDCMLVEKFGSVKVRSIPGNYGNIKITTPEDLKRYG